MINPTVSIIIYFNRDRGWLKECVQSVNNLRYNGKIDLIVESNPNYNASQNLNEGIKKAKGKYIRYLSEDDLLPQYSIHESVLKLEESDADFIHGNAVNFWGYPVIYPEGHISFSGRTEKQIPTLLYPSLEDMLIVNRLHGGTVVYKTEVLKENLFDESLTSAEEYDVNLKLLKKGFKLDYANNFLYFYRRHTQQKSLGVGANQDERTKVREQIKSRYRE